MTGASACAHICSVCVCVCVCCDREMAAELEKGLRSAKQLLKKARRKDYYKILEVSRDAGEEEIKKGYRRQCLKYHPDKNATAEEAEKVRAEAMFKVGAQPCRPLMHQGRCRMQCCCGRAPPRRMGRRGPPPRTRWPCTCPRSGSSTRLPCARA